jgi:hypothetical protein
VGKKFHREMGGEKTEKAVDSDKKFPKAVPFILVNAFFERFCSGGVFGKFNCDK